MDYNQGDKVRIRQAGGDQRGRVLTTYCHAIFRTSIVLIQNLSVGFRERGGKRMEYRADDGTVYHD